MLCLFLAVITWLIIIFLHLSSEKNLGSWEEGSDADVSFRPECSKISYSLPIDQWWVLVLIFICCKKKLLQ